MYSWRLSLAFKERPMRPGKTVIKSEFLLAASEGDIYESVRMALKLHEWRSHEA